MFLIWPNEGLIERLSETREFALEWATERSCFALSKKNGHRMQTIVNNNLLRFTHETEKDKTENVFLGMTKLGKTKLGIRFAENLFYEIPTFMAKTRISKYEKFKN